jgi:hypothetical protein
MSILNNLGSTLVYIAIIVFVYSFYVFLSILSFIFPNYFKKLKEWLGKKIIWNFMIAFLLQQFQQLLMLSLVNFYDLRNYTLTDYFSGVLAIILTAITLSFIVFSLVILKLRNTKKLSDEVYDHHFSSLTTDLSMKGTIGTYWRVLTIIRSALVSAILVFLKDYPEFQIITNLLLSGTFTGMMIVNPPFESPGENKIHLFNELMTSAYLYTLYAMTDYNQVVGSKETFGILLFGIVVASISVNILLLLFSLISRFYKYLNMRVFRNCRKRDNDKVIMLKKSVHNSSGFTVQIRPNIS